MCALGAVQLAKDGSFWRDEASVAQSLLALSPLEMFGPLEGMQSFPRLYLAVVDTLVTIFGYETVVARALPFAFFLLASAGWVRVLWLRFPSRPALLSVGVLLTLLPAQWFVYSSMLKPYTFDVAAALVPFLLRDDFYDETLGRGHRIWRLALLAGVGALSYPYAMVLGARVGGWWLAGLRAGRRPLPDVRAGVTLLACMGLAVTSVWLTDLRHTTSIGEGLRGFWSACILGQEGTSSITLLDRFAFGWYAGQADFARGTELSLSALLPLRLSAALGLAAIAASLLRGVSAGSAPPGWGSRSQGYALVALGLPLASLIVGYPICAGRLTLFALLPLQIIMLEGLDTVDTAARKLPRGGWIAAGLALVWIALLAPTTARNVTALAGAPAPDDLRGALARAAKRPSLPIISNACTRRQIETLPEGTGGARIFYQEEGGAIAAALESPEAWMLSAKSEFCQRGTAQIRQNVEKFRRVHGRGGEAQLVFVRFRASEDDVNERSEP